MRELDQSGLSGSWYSNAGIPAIWAGIFPCSHVHQASPANWVSAGKSQLVFIFFLECQPITDYSNAKSP